MAAGALARQPEPALSVEGRPTPEQMELKFALHRKLAERINVSALSDLAGDEQRGEVRAVVLHLVREEKVPLSGREQAALAEEILNEAFGLGPLEPLLQDPTISDILVTTPKLVYVERDGRLMRTPAEFKDEAHLLHILGKVVARVGRRLDESSPMVDARLPDGSRVNAVIPPIAVDGSLLSIRRFRLDRLEATELLGNLTMTPEMLQLLQACVQSRLNIIISGGTGAGKTTLLNVLSSFIPEDERIITIEDTAELQLRQTHVARLETRPADIEERGAVRQRDLVINALRMRPDRIIVGEVRGPEALDMLQAMNTGHNGSLTTVHANAPRDAITRLEVMVSMANPTITTRAIRQHVSSAIDLFVHVARFSDGSRRITHITECTGMESDIVTLQDIFTFEKVGVAPGGRVTGRFKPSGIRPKFNERLQACGFTLPASLFQTAMELR
jgi:pilus assembly protein CpaF